MSQEKIKMPSSEGKSENGKQGCFDGFVPVQGDSTTGAGKGQEVGPVERILLSKAAIGQENAVTRREIANALGLQKDGERKVSKLLEKERQGRTICSCARGLFLPAEGLKGEMEVRRYLRKCEAIAKGTFMSLRAARLRQKVLDGQTSFEDQEEG